MTVGDMTPAVPLLIVEDDRDVRFSLVQVLEEEGYQVATAGDGQEALTLLRAAARPAPAAILLDMMMPRMDGREFLANQARDPALAGIPVLVLSASESARRDATVTGLTTVFLKKPFSLERLLALVQKMTDRDGQRGGGGDQAGGGRPTD